MVDLNETELKDLIYDEGNQDWWSVTKEEVVETGRWDLLMERVFTNTEVFIRVNWRVPATEYQEVDLDPTYTQVKPVYKTVTVYE